MTTFFLATKITESPISAATIKYFVFHKRDAFVAVDGPNDYTIEDIYDVILNLTYSVRILSYTRTKILSSNPPPFHFFNPIRETTPSDKGRGFKQ
jgi:hypothetical protein